MTADTDPSGSEAEALARACAETMYAEDRTAQHLAMSVDSVGPGSATVSMAVQDWMLNGHDICHGGLIFTLADTAFAYACNSQNNVTVAQHCTITFISPGRRGERLTARARERAAAGRNGIYDIRVTGTDGRLVAEFRGNSFATGKPLVGTDAATRSLGGEPR